MVRDPGRRRFPLTDRFIEVVDDRLTGEVLLDEALKMIKTSERMSVGTWIDLMSGAPFSSPGPLSLLQGDGGALTLMARLCATPQARRGT